MMQPLFLLAADFPSQMHLCIAQQKVYESMNQPDRYKNNDFLIDGAKM